MKRGDVVTVVATGDYGKPRPAVIVLQTDAFPANRLLPMQRQYPDWALERFSATIRDGTDTASAIF